MLCDFFNVEYNFSKCVFVYVYTMPFLKIFKNCDVIEVKKLYFI